MCRSVRSDGGGEERSAGKTDRTVMGPLDQARIRSRTFPAGRPFGPGLQIMRRTTAGKQGRSLEESELVCWGSLDHHSRLKCNAGFTNGKI